GRAGPSARELPPPTSPDARSATCCSAATPSSPDCHGLDRWSETWEPEPLRFLGVQAVNSLLAAGDRRERRTGRPALAVRVGNLISGRET
ncbi:MAG: hypothetical protein WBP81_17415, partial [Solirubrobacteraceae bacterium]